MWNADQYLRYREERSQPAYDLMDFISPRSDMRIVDLGCGTGEHTKTLHERYRATETVGLDSSEEMLAKAPRMPGLVFERSDIGQLGAKAAFDLIFSNAALHWVPDHEQLFARLYEALRPGGQLAVQMPANGDHIVQRIAFLLEKEAPYNHYPAHQKNVLSIESYATLLHILGFKNVKVRMFVYLHTLDRSEDTVEWTKGSLLTHYKATMPASTYDSFEAEYRRRVVATLSPQEPYLFTFKRILLHAIK